MHGVQKGYWTFAYALGIQSVETGGCLSLGCMQ